MKPDFSNCEACEPTDRDFINLHLIAAVVSCTFLMMVAAFTLT